ncbi:hypothetical protein [Streptomyces glaucescens]|uniref:50S ribosomal protein L11 methyltransferase n=1 Tax=Streptomyces glaucescens TaxID=1907 RepID=A0A089X583_STRGA|nr:hypothetical protein [Streptomyces glaucescens]AIR98308.1 hypothetical protein SGLAU_11535 [Streptomyces glaucescens]
MKWLLTVPADTDLGGLAARLSTVGVTLLDVAPVPLGDDEVVVQGEGPADLAARVADLGLPVRVNPGSEFDLGF